MNEIPEVKIKERGDYYIALYFMLACLIALTSKGSENDHAVFMYLLLYILSFFSLKCIIQEMDGGIQAFSY
jgi:hypothetical protein